MPLSRRELLRMAGASFLGASCTPAQEDAEADPAEGPAGRASGSPGAEESLHMATIPSSGERVPGVGIGTRNYRARVGTDDLSELRETLRVFHDNGGRVLDTAPGYGNSEEVLGHLLGELGIREAMWIATKVDRESRDEGIERMERSFRLLGGDVIDLMQVHNLRGAAAQLETMKAWKEQGRLRYIGVTTSSDRQYPELERLMRSHDLDFVQVDYALDNRTAGETLLPLARDRGMAVLVNLPFGRGRLFEAVGDRPLPAWAADLGAESWAQVFLKYVMSAPGSVIPIPGTTKPHHAADNIGAARGRLPDAATRREMERFIDELV